MKKALIVFMCVAVVTLILLFICYNKSNELQIDESTSYFSNFYIEGEKVYIHCIITIENSYSDDKKVKLNAILKDDVELGLLKEENLKGYNEDLTSDEFTINAKSSSTLSVTFIGDFAGTNKKHDKNLPEIVIEILN